MLEKDIENLVAKYPEEFFSGKDVKLIGQQVKLGQYFADIIFEDDQHKKVIVEIKRGILSREAVAQLMDYYGMVKMQEPTSAIRLVLMANVIPKERVLLLSEKLEIEFVEVPVSKVLNVAEKYSYQFLDSDKPQIRREYIERARIMDQNVIKGESNVWIFQSNPARFDILNALEELEEDVWDVKRYKDKIKAGDIGIIWMSGKDGGIFAISDVLTNPEYMGEAEEVAKFWKSDSDRNQIGLCVKLHYKMKFLNNPIFRQDLRNIPQLTNMLIFRQPQGVNFPVTQSEWSILSELIKRRLS
jgi:hypothetical protein